LLLIERSVPSTTGEMAKVTRLSLDNNGELDRRRLNFREISGDADAPLESVGQDLRKAREKRGEDLEHISRLLKIRRDYLALLEEGAADSLPGRAYAIGFVRSYATYLGLDGNEYVERLKAEIAGRGENREPQPSAAPPMDWSWLQGQWVLAGLLAVALLYAGYYLIVSATRVTEQPVLPVPARLAAEAGLPPTASAPAPAGQAPGTAPTPATPPAPAAVVSSPPAQAAPALPAGQTYGTQNTNSRITLRVHRPLLVTVAGANNRIFINRTLQAGDRYIVPNIAGLRLSAPDSGAVELIVDGTSVGFAGDNGVVANNMPLNPQDLAARQNRG
jgi:cytoskeleton protein RodZ